MGVGDEAGQGTEGIGQDRARGGALGEGGGWGRGRAC